MKRSNILIRLFLCSIIFVLGTLIVLNLNKNNNYEVNASTNDKLEYAEKIPVLTFHRLSYEETKNKYFKDNEWVQSIDMFEKQIEYLYENGYKTISLNEFYCWYVGKCEFSKKTVLLTFDDGDQSTYYLALPILKRYNYKGVAFIVGSRTKEIDENIYQDDARNYITKDIVRRSLEDYPNFEYESHSYDFHYKDGNVEHVLNMTEEEIQEDFDRNSKFNFKYIAYPYGAYNEKLLKKVEENEFLLGFTFKKQGYATRTSPRLEIPRLKINGYSDIQTLENILNY